MTLMVSFDSSVHLVVLDTDHSTLYTQGPHEQANTLDQPVRMFQHDAVIAGQVGLAFTAIGDQGVDPVFGWRFHFNVGRECGAAQADHAAVLHGLNDFIRAHGIDIVAIFVHFLLRGSAVDLENDALNFGAAGAGHQPDAFDAAGGRCVLRYREKPVRFSDRLAPHHFLPRLHQWNRRLAGMLR
jgi:hypothetical protein